MNQADFSNYKFRCSVLPDLMTSSRAKDSIGKTAEAVIRQAWIKQVFDREKYVTSPAMQKGTMVESDVLELIKQTIGQTYFKNNKELENDFIKGTPDVKSAPDRIIDVKSSFDLWTFAAVDEKTAYSNYFWQLAGYAYLEGKDQVEIIYGLVNTPEAIMYDLYRVMGYSMDEQEAEKIVRSNHTYDDIDPQKRIKRYVWSVLPVHIDAIKSRVQQAREIMQQLSL